MSKELLETLDALSNERPSILQLKRKHFENDQFSTLTKRERLEWMRLNAEKDRVQKFKNVAVVQTKSYYTIIDTFSKMFDKQQNVEQKIPE